MSAKKEDEKNKNGTKKPILESGRNCWRVEQARRAAFLIDGADYFKAFRSAVAEARESVFIIGWDIHSLCRLVRDEEPDELPVELGEFLNAVVSRRKGLRIYVLTWDFVMLFAFGREWLPLYKLEWKTHRRLKFRMDAQHPLGSSHHQKVVVIDDEVAFCGGLDLTHHRWDTSEHRPDDPRRRDPLGENYPPFHDVQMVVEGEIASALGDLARDRWRWATGKKIASPKKKGEKSPWPQDVDPDFTDVPIAISRTIPLFKTREEVREVQTLFEDAIAAARRFIYIENQYLSSFAVGDALLNRLKDPKGPEIVIVLPNKTSGWLEQTTMDVLRARLLKRLREADTHNRLAVYYPDIPGLTAGFEVNVHSKVMIVDDDLVRVGSANISNRSMGFDTECDLAIEAQGEEQLNLAIGEFRNRLLAEHLDIEPETVQEAFSRKGSLIATVESLRGEGRTLKVFDGHVDPEVDELVPEDAIVDRERPITLDEMTELFIPREEFKAGKVKLSVSALLMAGFIGLAIAWRWTPLNDWLQLEVLLDMFASLKNNPIFPVWVIGGFLLGGILVVPVTLLIVVTVLALGPLEGFIYSLVGTLLSASLTFSIGHFLGRDQVRRLAGKKLNKISRQIAERGVLSVISIRMIPIAPFTIVNIVAGASHLHFRDFALGSFLGMLPGMLATAILIDQFGLTLRNPDFSRFSVLGIILAAVGLVLWFIRRWLMRKTQATQA